jgi:hypothetical protein
VQNSNNNFKYWESHLDGVMVIVLAIGSKFRGFKPGLGDGFLGAIKIRSTPSFGGEMNRHLHVERCYGTLKIISKYIIYFLGKIQHFICRFLLFCY